MLVRDGGWRRETRTYRVLGPAGQARVQWLLDLAPLWAVLLGAVVRLNYVLPQSFPLDDGGMFYQMIEELRQARYALPAYTGYNGVGIPFAYPPLGFYLAGLLADVGHWPLLGIMRFLPLAVNLLAIAVFYPLGRSLLPSRAPAYAVLAFAMLPFSFYWNIMGGGIARAPGQLFSILALWQGYRLYATGRRQHLWATIVLASATVLSHPSAGLFLAYSLGLMLLFYGRGRAGLVNSLILITGTVALTAPWWATVLVRYGPGPLLSAVGTGGPAHVYIGLVRLAALTLTGEPGFALLGGLALLGLLVSLRDRQFFLPVWLVATFTLDATHTGPTAGAVPLALLAGLGVAEAVLPLLARAGPQSVEAEWRPVGGPTNMLAVLVLLFLLEYSTLTARIGQQSDLVGLQPQERQAMQWVASHTPAGSTFLVIAPEEEQDSYTAEWFPVLAQRPSVATYQGYEWLGRERFRSQTGLHLSAQACAGRDATCLESLSQATGAHFDYVYVKAPAAETAPLRASLAHDPRYRAVYEGPAAVIYERSG